MLTTGVIAELDPRLAVLQVTTLSAQTVLL